jgi:hypothetical protein
MRTLCKSLLALSIVAAPLFSGALVLQVGDPAANSEAHMKHAVLVAKITACKSPERIAVTAVAEGIADGALRSIPLKVIQLSTPGTFAVMREWPERGTWAVKIIATNPDYKNYAASVLVPFDKNSLRWAGIKHYLREPTNAEIAAVLGGELGSAGTSLN